MADLDQGGTFRQCVNGFLGPTVGWLRLQTVNILPVTSGLTVHVQPGVTLVAVNVANTMSVYLPSVLPALGVPATFPQRPITVVDTGGNAGTDTILIIPWTGETIMGLSSIPIQTAYGAYTLIPDPATKDWVQQ